MAALSGLRNIALTLVFLSGTFGAASAASNAKPAPSTKADAATVTADKVLGEVDGWTIAVSGSLGGCFAGASFDNDTIIWLGLGGTQDRGFFVITNPAWTQLQTGRTHDLKLNAPGQAGWRGKATAIQRGNDKGFLVTDLKDEVIGGFARAETIEVQLDNRTIAQLPLTASSSAIATVIQCQVRFAKARDQEPEDTPKKQRTGTGFFVSWRGQILTNHHVVEGCSVIEVARPGSASVPARLVADDSSNDLALLQTSLRTRELPAFVTRARIGQGIYVYGFPLQDTLASTGNFTIGSISASAGIGDDTSRLQISAPVQPGNSGGPVLDQNGNVVGVLVSSLINIGGDEKLGDKPLPQNANFAIKASAATTFLDAYDVDPMGKVSATPLDATAIAQKAKEFTVRVECDLH